MRIRYLNTDKYPMLADPIQPFRDEFLRWFNDPSMPSEFYFGYYDFVIAPSAGQFEPECTFKLTHHHCTLVDWYKRYRKHPSHKGRFFVPEKLWRIYRAAKVLQIAETQSPEAALLWKLANA